MKKLKLIISMCVAVAMLMSISVTAFAAELNQETTSGNAIAVYQAGVVIDDNNTPDDPTDDTMGGTYTVTIPDFINVAGKDATATVYDVVAQDVLIPFNTSLKVSVDFENHLKLNDNTDTIISYDLKSNPQSEGTLSSISTGNTVLTVAAGTPDAVTTSQMSANITEVPSYSGIYENTVTFNVAVA